MISSVSPPVPSEIRPGVALVCWKTWCDRIEQERDRRPRGDAEAAGRTRRTRSRRTGARRRARLSSCGVVVEAQVRASRARSSSSGSYWTLFLPNTCAVAGAAASTIAVARTRARRTACGNDINLSPGEVRLSARGVCDVFQCIESRRGPGARIAPPPALRGRRLRDLPPRGGVRATRPRPPAPPRGRRPRCRPAGVHADLGAQASCPPPPSARRAPPTPGSHAARPHPAPGEAPCRRARPRLPR